MSGRDLTLALDASTYEGTVALFDREHGAEPIAAREVAMRGRDEERLMPAVVATLAEAGVQASDLARIVCGAGPGSFTSLRIAGAIAKGLALALDRPLHAVDTALLIAGSGSVAPGMYVAVLDAMRGDVYATAVDVRPDGARLAGATVVMPAQAALSHAHTHGRRTLGPAGEVVAHPHARAVGALLVLDALGDPVELDGWEPSYGRLAEAQVKWEAAHGRPLAAH